MVESAGVTSAAHKVPVARKQSMRAEAAQTPPTAGVPVPPLSGRRTATAKAVRPEMTASASR
ncbi:hypothetical protein ACWIG4_05360 [Streptomyces sp. NPDC002248]